MCAVRPRSASAFHSSLCESRDRLDLILLRVGQAELRGRASAACPSVRPARRPGLRRVPLPRPRNGARLARSYSDPERGRRHRRRRRCAMRAPAPMVSAIRFTVAVDRSTSPSIRLDGAAGDRPWTNGEKTVTDAPRVLVVEDEPNIRELVCLHLGLEGLRVRGRRRRPGGAAAHRGGAVRSAGARRDAARPRRRVAVPRRAQRPHEPRRADPDAHGAERGVGQGHRPRERRRRLPDQAVRRARAGRAGARAAAAAAPERRRPAPRRRRATSRRRSGSTASRSIRRAAASASTAATSSSPIRSSACCTCSPPTPASSSAAKRCSPKIWRGDTFVTVRSVDTLVKRLRRRIEPTRRTRSFLLTVWGSATSSRTSSSCRSTARTDTRTVPLLLEAQTGKNRPAGAYIRPPEQPIRMLGFEDVSASPAEIPATNESG